MFIYFQRNQYIPQYEKITKHYSVTEFLRSDPKNYTDTFPEFSDAKEINCYLFESKVESYIKAVKPVLLVLIRKKKYAT